MSTSGWTATDGGPSLDRPVDAVRSGTTAGLTFPEAAVSIDRPDDREWTTFDYRDGPVDLAGPFVLKVELPVVVFVAAEGAGRLASYLRVATRRGTLLSRPLTYLLDRLSLLQLPDPRGVTRATLVSESVDASFP